MSSKYISITLNGLEWEEVWDKKNSQEVVVFHGGNNKGWISENW